MTSCPLSSSRQLKPASDRFPAKSMQLPTFDDTYQQAEALIVEAHYRKLRQSDSGVCCCLIISKGCAWIFSSCRYCRSAGDDPKTVEHLHRNFPEAHNEFCRKERGPVLERAGTPRAYKY